MQEESKPKVDDYLSRAEALFKEASLMTKSAESEDFFTMKVGNANASWSFPESYDNPITDISGIEIPIESPYLYRIIRPDSSAVWCRVELLYAKSENNEGNDGIFLMYYVPTAEYASSHPTNIEGELDNGGDMKDFSGLKIYTTVDGYFVRINRYCEGICTKGLYFGTEEDIKEGFETFISLLGGMTIQRYRKVEGTKV